jgi:hypothetical protein
MVASRSRQLPPPPAEPTNGLDSSTALSIMEHIVHWAHTTDGTVVAALQAPTPELVAAFDSLIVMGDGHVIYHGPVDGVTGYFRALGYGLPSTCDLGDWLAELATSPATTRAVYADDPSCVGLPPAKHTTLPALAEAWAASPQAAQLMATPTASTLTLASPQAVSQWKAEQVNGAVAETRLLVARQFKLLTRNKTLVLGKINPAIIMGAIIGSVFYRPDQTQFVLRISLALFACIFVSYSNMVRGRPRGAPACAAIHHAYHTSPSPAAG